MSPELFELLNRVVFERAGSAGAAPDFVRTVRVPQERAARTLEMVGGDTWSSSDPSPAQRRALDAFERYVLPEAVYLCDYEGDFDRYTAVNRAIYAVHEAMSEAERRRLHRSLRLLRGQVDAGAKVGQGVTLALEEAAVVSL